MQREKAVQQACVDLLTSVAGSVYVLGTRRPTGDYQGTRQTPGLPDVWFYLPRRGDRPAVAGWLECKAPKGRLSEAQRQFREECHESSTDHVTGGVDDLIEYLVSVGRLKGRT